MKITTNNFQILEGKNSFVFNEGINVIVGPNASGKSSLFYAIENCLTNPNGVSDCINFNADSTEVTIEDNNESVTWIRTLDSSTYRNNINNQIFVKASKLDSRDIANLGFYFDNKGNVVNIHSEWSILFPFGESDSDMFRLFEDIFNISCSFQIIDEMKKDEQNVKAGITNYQNQKVSLSDKIGICNKIKEKVNLKNIDLFINKIGEYEQQTSELRKDNIEFSKSSLLSSIKLPEVFDVSKLYDCYHNLETIKNDYEYYEQNKYKANLQIPKINYEIEDIATTDNIITDYEQYCTCQANIIDYKNQITDLNNKKSYIQEKINLMKVCPTCGRLLEE